LYPPGGGEELLADEDVSDDAFGVWLKQQRGAQRQARRQPLLQALSAAEQAGDLDSALAHANALLAQEPGEESHHASLMRVHYLRGETAAGLAVHERLVHTLQSLYNTEPAPATLQLAAALTRGRPATPQQPASVLPVLLRRPPLLAGRSTELAAVQQAWSDGQAALIECEAGLGKSRLINELTAGDAAAWVVSGRPGRQRCTLCHAGAIDCAIDCATSGAQAVTGVLVVFQHPAHAVAHRAHRQQRSSGLTLAARRRGRCRG